MSFTTGILFNGITGAVADIALNDLSKMNNFANLRPYFEDKYITQAALYAGTTTLIGSIVVFIMTTVTFGYTIPTNLVQTIFTLCVAFMIGYGLDVFIHKKKMFKGLDEYYKEHGSGFWGAVSLVVCMAISLFMQRLILPLLH